MLRVKFPDLKERLKEEGLLGPEELKELEEIFSVDDLRLPYRKWIKLISRIQWFRTQAPDIGLPMAAFRVALFELVPGAAHRYLRPFGDILVNSLWDAETLVPGEGADEFHRSFWESAAGERSVVEHPEVVLLEIHRNARRVREEEI